jgi:hypothetical protein
MTPTGASIAAILVLLCAACVPAPEPAPLRVVRIATGASDGVSYAFGEALARLYNEYAPGISASAEPSAGSSFNMDALDEGVADFAFARADVVYRSYVQGGRARPRPHLDVGLVLAFGIVGYFMRVADVPAAGLVLALVVGDRLEQSFRQAMELSGGDVTVFITRPISAIALGSGVAMVLLDVLRNRSYRRGAVVPTAPSAEEKAAAAGK